jgi:dTDP-4-dehydrorhamnose reductase
MRILILGGDGMLGHQLLRHLAQKHDARVTLRQPLGAYARLPMFQPGNSYPEIDVRARKPLLEALENFRPEAVINAVGIIKQQPISADNIANIEINALLPHRLALLCKDVGAKLVHFSTDCVFSGKTGNYKETDPSDPEDLYGKSKFLGEVSERHCITLRTSIIGRELFRKKSLLEWFLAQRGTVHGYRQVIYSGFTTHEIGRIVEKILPERPPASGVYHVSSAPISKYELLCLIKKRLRLAVEIVPDDETRCNRSLDSTRFRREFNYIPPTWDAMVDELAKDIDGAAK